MANKWLALIVCFLFSLSRRRCSFFFVWFRMVCVRAFVSQFASYSNIQIHHLIAHVLVCFWFYTVLYFRFCVLKYLSHLLGHISNWMILINFTNETKQWNKSECHSKSGNRTRFTFQIEKNTHIYEKIERKIHTDCARGQMIFVLYLYLVIARK